MSGHTTLWTRKLQIRAKEWKFAVSRSNSTVSICPVCLELFRSDELYKQHYKDSHSKTGKLR